MIKKKINYGQYLILILLVIIAFFCIRDIYIKDQVCKYGITTVVKFTSKERIPKSTKFNFTYYIGNKKYSTYNSDIKYSILNSDIVTQTIDSLKLNSFYLAKYLPQHPNIIIVDPSKEVKDTFKIKSAGFK